MKKYFSTIALILFSTIIYSQEIDLNQLNPKNRNSLEKENKPSLLQRNSLVIDAFTFSNFDRFIMPLNKYSGDYIYNFNFKMPFASQLEYLISRTVGISLGMKYKVLSYRYSTPTYYWEQSHYHFLEKTFGFQFMFNLHLLQTAKSDISIGIGLCYNKNSIRSQNLDTYIYNSTVKNNSTFACFRVSYRQIIFSNFGAEATIGGEYSLPKSNYYFNSSSQQFKPFVAIGLFYKIH